MDLASQDFIASMRAACSTHSQKLDRKNLLRFFQAKLISLL